MNYIFPITIFHLIASQNREFCFANCQIQFQCEITGASSKAKRLQHTDLYLSTDRLYTASVPSETIFYCSWSSVPKTINSSEPPSCQLSLELAQKELVHIMSSPMLPAAPRKVEMALNTVSFVIRLCKSSAWLSGSSESKVSTR